MYTLYIYCCFYIQQINYRYALTCLKLIYDKNYNSHIQLTLCSAREQAPTTSGTVVQVPPVEESCVKI